MSMQLSDDVRKQALASIMRYCAERTDLEIGNLEAVGLLDFILREIAPSAYNAVGLGTTQLYNRTLVYNHKRHGVFRLGNRQFDFRMKPRFPKKLTPEFLYVDLLNNLQELAEDRDAVLRQARSRQSLFDPTRLQRAADSFGSVATRKRLREWAGA